jgi:serine/threonine-protein kinase
MVCESAPAHTPKLATALHHYAYGKPKETVEQTGPPHQRDTDWVHAQRVLEGAITEGDSLGHNEIGGSGSCQEALALPPEQHARFLEDRCGPDTSLREELASLIAASVPSAGYFDGRANAMLLKALAAAALIKHDSHGELRRGDIVAHYEVIERIGGGMGMVYKARDLTLGRAVALKFLPPALAADEEARRRLYAEARAASALDHASIGAVYEIGEAEPGGLFIALAWYDGETLKDKLRSGPLPVVEALAVARQIAAALAAAHAAGIIHRDVKPSNIITAEQGAAKLVDFGIAKVAGTEPTCEGSTPGTLAYMSPEQTRGGAIDGSTPTPSRASACTMN